jgi:N-dimethylarginine dimethylaminohydrolase
MGFKDNEYGKMRKVLLCKPDYFEWEEINEVAKKNLSEIPSAFNHEIALKEHDELADALRLAGVEVRYITPSKPHHYMVYTRDFGKNVGDGILFGRFRLPVRMGEDDLFEKWIRYNGFPVYGKVEYGSLEGGDMHFIDAHTLCVGTGARSSLQGVAAAQKLMDRFDVKVVPVNFDYKYLHLDLLFVLVAEKTCLACETGLPEEFEKMMKDREFDIIRVSEKDAMELKCNVVALGDGRVLSSKGNDKVNAALKSRGFEVYDPSLSMFTLGGGGPRCLTFPLERDPV